MDPNNNPSLSNTNPSTGVGSLSSRNLTPIQPNPSQSVGQAGVSPMTNYAQPAQNQSEIQQATTGASLPNPNPAVQPVQPQPVLSNPSQTTAMPSQMNKQSNKRKVLSILFILIFLCLVVFGGLAAFKYYQEQNNKKIEGEVVWWGLEEKAVYEGLIGEYEASHPGTKVNYQKQSVENYRERLANNQAKGEGPDIFTYHNTWLPMFISNLGVLPKETMSEAEYSETFYPVVTSNLASKDGILGIPLMMDGLVMYTNDDLLAAAAATPPAMWDGVRELAKLLTQHGENNIIIQSGAALGESKNIDHWQEIVALMMIQNGVTMNNISGILAEDSILYYTLFSSADKSWNDSLPQSTVAFSNGKVAIYIAPTYRAAEIIKQNPTLRFSVVPVPQVRKNEADDPDITYATYWVQGVWSKSKRQTLAWDFLKFMSAKESQRKLYIKRQEVYGMGYLPPRVDMMSDYVETPVIKALVPTIKNAKSWYMADSTFDGQTGINTQLTESFKIAVDALLTSRSTSNVSDIVAELALSVNSVLAKYGLVRQIILPK